MQSRRDEIAAELKPGGIVLMPVPGIDHEKFLVILTVDPIRAFFINKRIHEKYQSDPNLVAAQVGISKADHRFLDKDSWIDCTTVVTAATRTRVLTEVTADPNRLKGRLIPSERAALLAAVDRANNKKPSKFEKDRIFEAFGATRAPLAGPARS